MRTLRVNVLLRRPSLPHLGQGAFLGAALTGITTGVGAPVPMLASLVKGMCFQTHSPGRRPYLSRPKWVTTGTTRGGVQREVSEFHSRLGVLARQLARELYPDGLPRGTKFSELEAVAGALGDEMARQLIEINVQEQADDWPEQELGECPVCGGAARKAPDEPRVVTTTRGDVTWKQRVANCPRCRRAFFPSESSVGH